MNLRYLDTPVGTLAIGAHDRKLKICDWIQSPHFEQHCLTLTDIDNDFDYSDIVITQLMEYFAGKRKQFEIVLAPEGTPFKQRVWKELTSVVYGTTASYKDIAARIGKPSAARSVAGAISQNPVNIIIPCHRIIGANGALTGYAGGLDTKKSLLQIEKSEFRVGKE